VNNHEHPRKMKMIVSKWRNGQYMSFIGVPNG
jgi:hypothetical protein